MNWFAAMSIKNKLTLIIAAVASAVALLTRRGVTMANESP